jgi:hypothetical protein
VRSSPCGCSVGDPGASPPVPGPDRSSEMASCGTYKLFAWPSPLQLSANGRGALRDRGVRQTEPIPYGT